MYDIIHHSRSTTDYLLIILLIFHSWCITENKNVWTPFKYILFWNVKMLAFLPFGWEITFFPILFFIMHEGKMLNGRWSIMRMRHINISFFFYYSAFNLNHAPWFINTQNEGENSFNCINLSKPSSGKKDVKKKERKKNPLVLQRIKKKSRKE